MINNSPMPTLYQDQTTIATIPDVTIFLNSTELKKHRAVREDQANPYIIQSIWR